jgi:hypothetical protein
MMMIHDSLRKKKHAILLLLLLLLYLSDVYGKKRTHPQQHIDGDGWMDGLVFSINYRSSIFSLSLSVELLLTLVIIVNENLGNYYLFLMNQ